MIWICCSFFCSQRSLGSSFRLNDVIPAHWLSRWINPSINLVEISLSRCPKRSSSLVTCGFLFSSFGACVCVCLQTLSLQFSVDNWQRECAFPFDELSLCRWEYCAGKDFLLLFVYLHFQQNQHRELSNYGRNSAATAWCDRWNFRSFMSVLVVRFVARKKMVKKRNR